MSVCERWLEEETGEAALAGWVPCKPTLKPGPDWIGKVWEMWKPQDNF